jgi:hypothetical protein
MSSIVLRQDFIKDCLFIDPDFIFDCEFISIDASIVVCELISSDFFTSSECFSFY